ncbi:MAG: hypothetical protein IJV00_04785 [Clostridia bacterium]|nr:hypothetical protein [Clostridia bacterium]
MKTKTRSSKIICVLFLCVLLLCSCSETASARQASGSAPVSDAPVSVSAEVEMLPVIGEGAPGMTVLTPNARHAPVSEAANNIASSLGDLTGAEIFVLSESSLNKDDSQIIMNVGRTVSELSEKLYSRLAPDEIGYIIENGEIAIASVCEQFTPEACGLFLADFKAFAARGAFSVPANAFRSAKCSAPLPENLPVIPGADETNYADCSDGFYAVSYQYFDPEQFTEYLGEFEKAGFEKLCENAVGDTRSAVFTDGTTEVHAYYLYDSEVIRVVFGPLGYGVPREEESVEGSASLTLLPLKQFGLSMIFTLPDGRFVVVDGGQQSESRNLVKYLAENAPEEEMPVVAAWFFTHAHPDHTYAFFGVRDPSLYQQITVENFVFNFPCLDVYERYEPDCIAQTKNVRDTISFCFPDAKIIKPHTGDQMKLGGLTVDFLMTQEDLAPYSLSDFNSSSLVMRFALAGTTVMVTGDMSEANFALVNANYSPEDLKCDILQVPHHGWNRNKRFFESVDAEIVFIPNNGASEAPTLFKGYDIENVTKKALALYACAEKTVTIPLPYTADVLPDGYTLD